MPCRFGAGYALALARNACSDAVAVKICFALSSSWNLVVEVSRIFDGLAKSFASIDSESSGYAPLRPGAPIVAIEISAASASPGRRVGIVSGGTGHTDTLRVHTPSLAITEVVSVGVFVEGALSAWVLFEGIGLVFRPGEPLAFLGCSIADSISIAVKVTGWKIRQAASFGDRLILKVFFVFWPIIWSKTNPILAYFDAITLVIIRARLFVPEPSLVSPAFGSSISFASIIFPTSPDPIAKQVLISPKDSN